MSAFDPGADFPKSVESSEPIQLSEIKQKTYLNVNEKGTEAAAVTSVEMAETSGSSEMPFEMKWTAHFSSRLKI